MRILKAETKGLRDDDEPAQAQAQPPATPPTTTTAHVADAPVPPVVPVQPEHAPRKQP